MPRMVLRRPKAAAPKVAPTLRGSLQTKAASNVNIQTVSGNYFPTASVAGDYIIAAVSWRRSSGSIITADTPGWTQLDFLQVSGFRMFLFGKVREAGENTMTFSASNAASGTSVIVDAFAYQGINTAAPMSKNTQYASTGGLAEIVIPGLTAPPLSALVAVAMYSGSAAARTATWDAPLTETGDLISGTTGAYLGATSAVGNIGPSGVIGDVRAVLSASQGNRAGILMALNPA